MNDEARELADAIMRSDGVIPTRVRPFKRRCGWCAVTLSWWQLNLCRRCGKAVRGDAPSAPVTYLSRPDEHPDAWTVSR